MAYHFLFILINEVIDIKNIGQKLKDRRVELGFSLEDIHKKTKLSLVHLQAIENGNMDYFRHDISYLKFFLQYYCQAVYMDFDDIKDDYEAVLNDYTQTQILKKQEQKQTSNQNIQKRIQANTPKTPKTSGIVEKINFQAILMIVGLLLLIAVLIFSVVKFVIPLFSNNDLPINETIVIPKEPSKEEKDVVETPVISEPEQIEEPYVVTVVQENPLKYVIGKVQNKPTLLKIAFNEDTWIQAYINGTKTNNPVSQVYKKGQQIEFPIDLSMKEVMFHLGYFKGNDFFINNTKIELDQSTANKVSGAKITFVIEGETQ